MTDRTRIVAVTAAAIVLLTGSGVAGVTLALEKMVFLETTTVEPLCGEQGIVPTDPRLCAARGVILYGSLYNIQGAGQFCKWKASNPGEWTRIKEYLSSRTPAQVITWFGASLRDQVQAYFEADGPVTIMPENTAMNICKTPLAPPTDLTVGP